MLDVSQLDTNITNIAINNVVMLFFDLAGS